ncbi:MAG: PolC-type DNA polymerase III [Anaeroplasmataceae bacterium]
MEKERIELHLHTKMSALDGVTDAIDYIKAALNMGWKGIAITDIESVNAIVDVENYLHSNNITDFKPIYGTELSYIDDSKGNNTNKEYYATFLAINKVGKKNLYKLLSDALTTHLSENEAKALKSVIEKYREGILVGSSSASGEIFDLALTGSKEELIEAMKFYDYIEVSPASCYNQFIDKFIEVEKPVLEVIKKIVMTAKSLNKLVVATSDCYYLNPDDKKYREVLVETPDKEGYYHSLAGTFLLPDSHLRTTSEMLKEFEFMGEKLAYEIVVENTNKILDMTERYEVFPHNMFAPADDEFSNNPVVNNIKSIKEESRRIVYENIKGNYGDNPHPIITKRIERELELINKSGHMSEYYVTHLLVKKSLDDGYIVGSRGLVGSSLVATMMGITDVNPLKPHYICKKCKFHTIKMSTDEIKEYGLSDIEKPFQEYLSAVSSGFDLPNAKCPCCGNELSKNGHDIPFESFLGIEGEKSPDIDLNFSGEYQSKAQEYLRTIFGKDNAFRAGTISTLSERTSIFYVKDYYDRIGVKKSNSEIKEIASHIEGVRRSTGKHPGGIVIVPKDVDIYDITPIQYPANDKTSPWRTSHFDYHTFENNLLKLDILGHDSPTVIKYLMDYVKSHQEEFPFDKVQDIPIDDPKLLKLFSETEVIGLTKEELGSLVASSGIPEFGTGFTQYILTKTKPRTFAELVKLSALSHGTNVWRDNAEELISGNTKYGKIPLDKVIGCRDDIMLELMRFGMSTKDSFDIMEFVRKGKAQSQVDKWKEYALKMKEANVPDWYIWSCGQINYIFPKAHATAYALMSLRMAWFKVYYPKLFYSAWFSKSTNSFDVEAFVNGPKAIKAKIDEIKATSDISEAKEDLLVSLQVAYEMTLRGIKFIPVDINKSHATDFEIEGNDLRIPLVAVNMLSEKTALNIIKCRNEQEFTSVDDAIKRLNLSSEVVQEFKELGVFGNIPEN